MELVFDFFPISNQLAEDVARTFRTQLLPCVQSAYGVYSELLSTLEEVCCFMGSLEATIAFEDLKSYFKLEFMLALVQLMKDEIRRVQDLKINVQYKPAIDMIAKSRLL